MYSEKSRSQKKRDSTTLQKLGEELASLPPSIRRGLQLPPDLLEALTELSGMSSHEARRRQLQYIGRVMRGLDDPEAIAAALQRLRRGRQQDAAQFQALESLRADLLSQDPATARQALAQVLTDFAHADEANLRRLIAGAHAEADTKGAGKSFRALFRYLKELHEQSKLPAEPPHSGASLP